MHPMRVLSVLGNAISMFVCLKLFWESGGVLLISLPCLQEQRQGYYAASTVVCQALRVVCRSF